MQATEQITITLPASLIARIRKRVEQGEFVNESQAVTELLEEADEFDGFGANLPESGEDVEHWIRTEVAAALDELDRDPTSVLTIEEVRAHLAADLARYSHNG